MCKCQVFGGNFFDFFRRFNIIPRIILRTWTHKVVIRNYKTEFKRAL